MKANALGMTRLAVMLWLTACFQLSVAWADDLTSGFSNQDGIINTRHNMSQSTEASNQGGSMNVFRNRYGEVCVYCHTPHASNANVSAPLWNRRITTETYTVYNSESLSQTANQPGASSLACLTCHDGQQAIDAILNMPGSGQYSATADPTTWNPLKAGLPSNYKSVQHRSMIGCMACHGPDTGFETVATDFTAFMLGTDLSNDHPVGVVFPTAAGSGTDWNEPDGTRANAAGTSKFFDENGNGRMDKTDIRLYDSGSGASVECASCHDPHGVPSGGAGSTFNRTFLRKDNAASAVCLTCHAK